MNDRLSDIKARLKFHFDQCYGHGKWSDQYLIARTEQELMEKFGDPNHPAGRKRVNATICVQNRRIAVKDMVEDSDVEAIERTLLLVHYFSYSESGNSESVVTSFLEEFIQRVNGDRNLNGAVNQHNQLQLTNSVLDSLGSVMIHLSVMEITTLEIQDINEGD